MPQPNYSQLLRTLWYSGSSTPTQTDEPNPQPNPYADVVEFLGDALDWEHSFPPQAPTLEPFPTMLPIALRKALESQGITALYSHQVKTYKAIRQGKDVVLTPPTAAGKTLAAYIPVLEGAIAQDHRCLSLYGLKALASDQAAKLETLLSAMPNQNRPRFTKLTGDVNKEERKARLATEPQILAITPDLLHFELKQVHWSEPWQQFLSQLRYVVIDELHSYSGVFGANLHWLIARLKLAVDRCGGNSKTLQFIGLSATIGNPKELMSNLIGRAPTTKSGIKRLVWIHHSGALKPEKRLVVTQPMPNPNAEVAKLMLFLMQQGLQGITFCNSRDVTKRIVQLVGEEAQLQGCPELGGRVASFYGGLDDDRRHQIVQQLETGEVRGIIATDALEAGIDLPQLDYCIIRGFPNTRLSFIQRMGRAGRKRPGLVVFVPVAQSLLDHYFSNPSRLLGEPEPVHFNPNYPVMVAKHLMCAASESGIQPNQIARYFGTDAVAIAQALQTQGHLKRRRDGALYAEGFPHGAVNFRGGIAASSIKLVESESGTPLETMAEDLAHREVFPGAIYRRQTESGAMQTYRCQSLEGGVAKLQASEDNALTTVPDKSLSATVERWLVEPLTLPLQFESAAHDRTEDAPTLTLELGFGTLSQQVKGYELQERSYERTCLNKTCLQHKVPLPGQSRCLSCGKPARDAELFKALDTVQFEPPYMVQFASPILSITLNSAAIIEVEGFVRDTKLALQNQPNLRQYQALWDFPSHWIAVHSLGHQLMKALPLVVLHAQQDLNYLCQNNGGSTTGLWFDTSDGGNGATEAVLRYWQKLVPIAIKLAESCECEAGCPKCLSQWGCPDQNKGLVKQVGLFILKVLRV